MHVNMTTHVRVGRKNRNLPLRNRNERERERECVNIKDMWYKWHISQGHSVHFQYIFTIIYEFLSQLKGNKKSLLILRNIRIILHEWTFAHFFFNQHAFLPSFSLFILLSLFADQWNFFCQARKKIAVSQLSVYVRKIHITEHNGIWYFHCLLRLFFFCFFNGAIVFCWIVNTP